MLILLSKYMFHLWILWIKKVNPLCTVKALHISQLRDCADITNHVKYCAWLDNNRSLLHLLSNYINYTDCSYSEYSHVANNQMAILFNLS